jgi:phosphopantetheinyl transferase
MNALVTPWPDRVLVLRLDETASVDPALFTEAELQTAAKFSLHKRRAEWLLSRLAAKQLAVTLGIAPDPRSITVDRPHIRVDGVASGWQISLSHSAPYAAAAIARGPIGIDVQVLRPLDERAAHVFLTDTETTTLQTLTIPNRILHFWCAKEAAFKQRSSEVTTLKQVPMRLLETRDEGLVFDCAETAMIGDVIVAITT